MIRIEIDTENVIELKDQLKGLSDLPEFKALVQI